MVTWHIVIYMYFQQNYIALVTYVIPWWNLHIIDRNRSLI